MSINNWWTSSFYSHFFSSIWRMQNIWSIVELLRRKSHWWSPIISFTYGINLEIRMLDKILCLAKVIRLRAKLRLLLYLYVELHYVHKDRLVAILLLIPCFNLVFWLLQFSRWQLYQRVKIRQFISLLECCVDCIIRIFLELKTKTAPYRCRSP